MRMKVRDKLNLRSRPDLRPDGIIVTLAKDEIVDVVDARSANGFVKVAAMVNGELVVGYMWRDYLDPVPGPPSTPITPTDPAEAPVIAPPPAPDAPPPVHLAPRGITMRKNAWGQAYALNEPGQPARNGTDATARASSLLDIVRWLRVEHRARYKPTGGTTYCNVYAYDYCTLAGAFLPRVWWRPNAISAIRSGRAVSPDLGKTVDELSANALYGWFDTWSRSYGWTRVPQLDDLQDAANRGALGVISGLHRDPSASGHISVVAPESATMTAAREDGRVVLPVQSQAGAREALLEYGRGKAWWTGKQFKAFGFWVHA